MRNALSITVAACFLLIATLANFSNSYAAAGKVVPTDGPAVFQAESDLRITSVDAAVKQELQAPQSKEDCPCKLHHGMAKFLCGVALALPDNSASIHTPSPTKTRYMLIKSTAVSDYVDRLKRPPRTVI